MAGLGGILLNPGSGKSEPRPAGAQPCRGLLQACGGKGPLLVGGAEGALTAKCSTLPHWSSFYWAPLFLCPLRMGRLAGTVPPVLCTQVKRVVQVALGVCQWLHAGKTHLCS